MKPERRPRLQSASGLIRLLWYGVATILILTLPIFSDRGAEPAPAKAAGGQAASSAAAVEGAQAGSSRSGAPVTGLGFRPSQPIVGGRGAVAGKASPAATPPTLAEQDPARMAAFRRVAPPPRTAPASRGSGSGGPFPTAAGEDVLEADSPSRRPALGGGGATVLGSELDQIQRGYNQAYATLFPQAQGGAGTSTDDANPFEDALGQDGAGDSGDPTPDPDGGGDDAPPTDPEPPSNPPEPSPEPEPPEAEPPGPNTPALPSSFRYLVIGDFPDNPPLMSRANLVGDAFVFENAYEVEFFPAALPNLIGFVNGEKVMITDLNQDGLNDLIVGRVVPAVGSILDSYLQVTPGRFQPHGAVSLFLQELSSFALIDLTGDGVDELAVLATGSNRLYLFQFQLADREWVSFGELVVPFQPGVLVASSAGAPLGTRQLYVINNDLNYVVSLNPRLPNSLRLGSRAPLNYLTTTEIDWYGAGDSQVLVFQLPDSLLLAERRDGQVRIIGAFDLRRSVPEVILGDYLGLGLRQIFWLAGP